MRFSTIVWGGHNPNSPESADCILETARLYRNYKNIHHEWHILVLDNYDRYFHIVGPLRDLNCHIINVNHLFYEKYLKYQKIHDIYVNNKYDVGSQFKNTVRLLIAHDFFSGEPFLNVDADLVVNDEPNLIVDANKCLHMGSTCFVYINDKNFPRLYNELLLEISADTNSFISKLRDTATIHHPNQNPWSILGPMPNNMGILEEGIFYAMLLQRRLDWHIDNQYLHLPFIYDLHKDLNESNWKRISTLKSEKNQYNFINTKHYINNKPLAYMHYQQNFRFILAFYLLQKAIGIPSESMYCPAMSEDMTPLRHDISSIVQQHCETIKSNQKTYRIDSYGNNFVPDILLCQLMNVNKHNTIFNTNLFSYKHMLDIERNGSLKDILNNNFWYSRNLFT